MIHKSSKQAVSTPDSATSATNADSPRQGAVSPDQTATVPTNNNNDNDDDDDVDSRPSTDSTHQSTEATHEKSDQTREATDPDLLLNTTDNSSTVDRVQDAVGTPINTEIQEEEPVRANNTGENDEGSGSGSLAAAVEGGDSNAEDSKVHSIRLASHIRGVPGRSKQQQHHHHHDEGESDSGQHHDQDQNATGSVPEGIESNTAETNSRHGHGQKHSSVDNEGLYEVEELDSSSKHAKRVADDQAKERHDYLAGAYKSPFRHTHKVEKVGREER
jgi:hypothetical protein